MIKIDLRYAYDYVNKNLTVTIIGDGLYDDEGRSDMLVVVVVVAT